MVFRDQSTEIIKKAQAEAQKPVETSGSIRVAARKGRRSSLLRVNARRVSQPEPSPSILPYTPKLDENGFVDFFANNFACSDSAHTRRNLLWLPKNFYELLKEDSARLSAQSIGCMALARLQNSSHHYQQAQNKYGQALFSLASTWRHDASVDTDGICLAVMFLGLYEILSTNDSSSRVHWTRHLSGLGALLENRLATGRMSEFCIRMFLQTRSQAILHALQSGTPVDEKFVRMSSKVRELIPDLFLPSHDLDDLQIRLAALQARTCTPEPVEGLLRDLIDLRDDLRAWMTSCPPTWTFSGQENPRIYCYWWDSRCDLYPATIISHVSTKCRSALIITLDLIEVLSTRVTSLETIDPCLISTAVTEEDVATAAPPPLSPELRQLVTEICATVPLFHRPPPPPQSISSVRADVRAMLISATRRTSMDAPLGGPLDPPRYGMTFWLFWMLEVVGGMRHAPPELTAWTVQCLRRVRATTGILKAEIAADRIESGRSSYLAWGRLVREGQVE